MLTGSKLGRKADMTNRSSCPTSGSWTTKPAPAIGSAFQVRLHGGGVLQEGADR